VSAKISNCKHCGREIVHSPDLSKQTKTEFYYHRPAGNVYCRNDLGMMLSTRAEPSDTIEEQ